jgi:U4/U6 small nuclear ribonucleoprotein PRP31
MALALDEDKRTVLKFVESKMHSISPNLSIVCGSEVAARLMGVAGGLVALSKMPSCNVQVISRDGDGSESKAQHDPLAATAYPHDPLAATAFPHDPLVATAYP